MKRDTGLEFGCVNLNWDQICIWVEFGAQAHQLIEVINEVNFIICRTVTKICILALLLQTFQNGSTKGSGQGAAGMAWMLSTRGKRISYEQRPYTKNSSNKGLTSCAYMLRVLAWAQMLATAAHLFL